MKMKFLYILASGLGMVFSLPCMACFAFDEDDSPVSFLKVSIEGFNECDSPVDQLSMLKNDLEDISTHLNEPTSYITPACSPDDEEEMSFLSPSESRSYSPPEIEALDEEPQPIEEKLLDPDYRPHLKLYDLVDFYDDDKNPLLVAVRTGFETIEFLNFIRILRNEGRIIPEAQLVAHPNFLCWKVDTPTETYITAVMKKSAEHYADINIYTLNRTPGDSEISQTIKCLNLIISSFIRESRRHKLQGFQFDVTADNHLMVQLFQKLKLNSFNKDIGIGTHYVTHHKRDHKGISRMTGHHYHRFYLPKSNLNQGEADYLTRSGA